MNTYKVEKARRMLFDMVLALFVVMFIMFAALSPTLGNAQFYSRHIKGNSAITQELQKSIKQKTDDIADKTGVLPEAFDFAVGQKKISAVQRDIINSVFAGINFDYSDSAAIKDTYHDGIKEYYRYNGLDLDESKLDRAVPMACSAFNEVMGIGNSMEMRNFITILSKYSIVLAVLSLLIAAFTAFKIFTLHHGRTKMFSHFGSAAVGAGDAMILISLSNLVINYANRLYLTNNYGFNTAFAGACRVYFIIIAIFGIAFVIAGISMIRYCDSYYNRRYSKQKQEDDINRSLYVKSFDGDDKTIGEIVENRRKEYNSNDNK